MLVKFSILNFKFSNNTDSCIEVYTTRPETIDGAMFLVMAPEHPLVEQLTTPDMYEEVQDYKAVVASKSEMERKENKKKTGVFTGSYVINPVTKKQMPVWISDYVLIGYGTGAIMAVPAEDERDREFAEKFKLPIEPTSCDAKPEGETKVQYHIHDWSISRQRYWGTPVPIIYCSHCFESQKSIVKSQKSAKDQRLTTSDSQQHAVIDGKEYMMHAVPFDQLPIELPYDVDFTPHGKPPLASNEKWLHVKCPKCGEDALRDAETLDTFFDSSWYYYRYVDPHFNDGPFDPQKVKELLPVNIYFGGAEHTLGHTLYARFFTKFFQDQGMVDFDEFAKKRVQHGIVLGPDGNKMSKSKLFMEADYLLGGSEVISEAADAVKFSKETIAKIWEELHDGVLLNLTSFGRMDSIESKEFDAALHELAKLPPTDKMAISYIPSEAMLDTFLKVIDFVDITIDSSQIVFFNSKKNQ
jgi:leucyl-tRNA synthetase